MTPPSPPHHILLSKDLAWPPRKSGADSPAFPLPRQACEFPLARPELSLHKMGPRPIGENGGQMTLLTGLTAFPASWDCPQPLGILVHSSLLLSVGRKCWV